MTASTTNSKALLLVGTALVLWISAVQVSELVPNVPRVPTPPVPRTSNYLDIM